MTETRRKIVVLTPVRNEAHLLQAFLHLTLKFADHVILAEQESTDATREIAEASDSVTVVENSSALFDNAARSALLINKARKLFGRHTVLIAIDADEFYCPSPEAVREFETVRTLAEGTTLFMDKPSFFGSTRSWIEYGPVFPLGYLDDGREYRGTLFHSRRVPKAENDIQYRCHSIKFAHLDALDMDAMLSKRRLYSIREKDAGNTHLSVRWKRNSRVFIQTSKAQARSVNPEVLRSFRREGIEISGIEACRPLWWDVESLKRFEQNGFSRYWWEDIWEAPWEAILEDSQTAGISALPKAIVRPPVALSMLRKALILIFHLAHRVVGLIRHGKAK